MIFVCPDGEDQYRRTINRHARRLTDQGHDFRYYEGPPGSDREWDERLEGAEGLLLLLDLPTRVMLRRPELRIVSFCGTGVRAFVDVEAAQGSGITVCNVVDYAANAVAEHAFALAFAVARSVVAGDRMIRAGAWSQSEGVELAGKTLGVVGAGPIGVRALEIGRRLGMKPLFWTRRPSARREQRLGASYVALPELFARSDVVSVHLAHAPETERLIGAELLSRMRPGGVFVNTARGAIVDRQALAQLLRSGRLRGAGIDVFDTEPPNAQDPLVACENAVLTPHLGFCTPEANDEVLSVGVDNLAAYANGAPQNVIGTATAQPGIR